MTTVYLVRHGQASFGADDYDKLSSLGVRQARVLGEAMRRRLPKRARFVSGSMLRHRETGAAFAEGLGAKVGVEVDERWNEYDHDEIIARHQPRYVDRRRMIADLAREPKPSLAFARLFRAAQRRWASGEHDTEYRESYAGFCARVRAGLDGLFASLAGEELAVVFTSGGPIGAVAGSLLGVPLGETITLGAKLVNAGLSKVVRTEHGLVLSTLNDHGHFEAGHGDLITYR